MLSEPALLVADEPTQGVDVGARAEIYRILREVAARGVPVVVASSDALELEGLCDRVIVMSRGQAVATLEGDDVTEERIVHAAISATMHSAEQAARAPGSTLAARPVHRGRLRAGRRARRRDRSSSASTCCNHNSLLPLGLQHQLRHVRVRGARLHLAGSDIRTAARRHRSLGRAARRLPRRPRHRSSCSTAARPPSGCSGSS